MATYK
jgi:hypothetical protein